VVTKIVVIAPKCAIHCKTEDFCHRNLCKEGSVRASFEDVFSHYFILVEINVASTGEQILKKRFPVK